MNVEELIDKARNSMSAGTVFAPPYEQDGVTVIAAARIAGGGGGGTGQDEDGPQGEGAGFGLAAKPAGVYVIENGKVRWQPAIDPHKIIAAVAAVMVVALISRALSAPWRTSRRTTE